VHALQEGPELVERKPWRKEGNELIGKVVRRFFEVRCRMPNAS